MDTQKIVTQFRLSGWGETVKERIGSGQTVEAFCEEKGISRTTYYYRQKKVREAVCAELVRAQNHDRENKPVPSGWAQLAKAEPVTTAESTVILEAGGCRIIANTETDPDLLAKVCRVLRSL
jgi:hypothetical protein